MMTYKAYARAYFTVEAVLLFPVILMVYLALFYLAFYQYDRCVAEQCLRLSLLQGTMAEGEPVKEVQAAYKRNSRDKYILAKMEDVQIERSADSIQGQLEGTSAGWQLSLTGECRDWEPVFWLRALKRLKKEDENGESDQYEPPISEDVGGAGEGAGDGGLQGAHSAAE